MSNLSKDSNFDKPVTYKKGSVLFTEGEASSYLYIVKTGRVRVVKEDKGKLIPISIIREKDFVGEMSMFNDEVRAASAIAEEDTEVLIIKKNDIRKVLKECPEWVNNIMVTLSDRLRNSIDILREHRIIDDNLIMGDTLSPQEEKNLKEAIEEYKNRRGIN